MEENVKNTENTEKTESTAKKFSLGVKNCENDIIAVINRYNFNPTISRLILTEILRILESAEQSIINE